MENRNSASFESRALPNIENPEAYHSYDVDNENYCDAVDIVADATPETIDSSVDKMNDLIDKINTEQGADIDHIDSDDMKDMVAHYNDYLNNLQRDIPEVAPEDAKYGLSGNAAPWVNDSGETLSEGGADQKWLPLSVSDFETIGIFKER